MSFTFQREEQSGGFRNTQKTTIKIGYHKYRIVFSIEGWLSKRFRRTLCLAVFRTLKPLLKNRHATVRHEDAELTFRWRDLEKDISLAQSVGIGTPEESRGYKIRMRRLKLGLTQEDFAPLAGLSHKHLSRLERGLIAPRFRTLTQIDEALARLEHGSFW